MQRVADTLVVLVSSVVVLTCTPAGLKIWVLMSTVSFPLGYRQLNKFGLGFIVERIIFSLRDCSRDQIKHLMPCFPLLMSLALVKKSPTG
jgi:hypothetical protein